MAKRSPKPARLAPGWKMIQHYWKWGGKGLANWRKRNPGREQDVPRMDTRLEKLAAKAGLKSAQFSTAMRIARLHSREEIDDILALIVETQSKFGTSHLTRLLAVAPAEDRMRLTKQAILEKWEFRAVDTTLKARHLKEKHGGRKPKTPKSTENAIGRMLQMSERWERLYETCKPSLPATVRRPANRIVRNIDLLRRKTQWWLNRHRTQKEKNAL